MIYNYDLLVIGGGSGGIAAARRAKELGAKVAIIEKNKIGGTCVNNGCIPKKILSLASNYSQFMSEAKSFGWEGQDKRFNLSKLIRNKKSAIKSISKSYMEKLKEEGVDFIKGEASFIDHHTISVNQKQISSNFIIIATGSSAYVPNINGSEYGITSDYMFQLETLPNSITVIGGGYIANEFASIMNGFGVKVNIVHRGKQLLSNHDEDIALHLQKEMQQKGINIILNNEVKLIERIDGNLKIFLSDNSKLCSDIVLFATGRKPKLDSLSLSLADLNINEQGFIDVNEFYQTSQPNIFAIGDVINNVSLTPVAIREGRIAAEKIFGKNVVETLTYNLVPTAIFSSPPIAKCGLSEKEAKQRGYDIMVYKTCFKPLKNLIAKSDNKTLIKMVVNKANNIVLGIHMIGEDSPEIIQAASVALTCSSTKKQFEKTIAIHPTASEELLML